MKVVLHEGDALVVEFEGRNALLKIAYYVSEHKDGGYVVAYKADDTKRIGTIWDATFRQD